MQDVTLGAGALADCTLQEARVRERFGVTVLAITRADGAVEANPSADTVMRAGDRIRLFGLPEQIAALLDYDTRGYDARGE
jgi:K+/H+ antiporter YhaU regulatory subunit KhtT